MSTKWPKVKLGEVMRRSEETIELFPDVEYREVTVRLWGNGVVERRRVLGNEIAGDRRFVTRAGQFILSRIDARNGAMGLIPHELEAAVVTNDFPLFNLKETQLLPEFLGWLCRTRDFVELCQRTSEGTTNRVRLKEDRFLTLEIPLPPLSEQRGVVAKIDQLAAKIAEARQLRQKIHAEVENLLAGLFTSLIEGAPLFPMRDIAPLVRRPVEIDPMAEYPELGIRSFGKGTFHKPALGGLEVGTKRLYRIKPGDLLFNNVFAWEGAVAVAKPNDVGRFGSHRFITCVPKSAVATTNFLSFFFLTPKGLEKLGEASPGGAGRNRTLGLETLANIKVPIPAFEEQLWFDSLGTKVESLKRAQDETIFQINALLPSILDKAFKGEL
jgi:type I restriction enzyme S subunit